jgi:hypothetical protein
LPEALACCLRPDAGLLSTSDQTVAQGPGDFQNANMNSGSYLH